MTEPSPRPETTADLVALSWLGATEMAELLDVLEMAEKDDAADGRRWP